MNSKSKDILLPTWRIKDLLIKATVHRTDTVSVVIGCSLNPIAMDISGLVRLTNALAIVRERLSTLIKGSPDLRIDSSSIPPHNEWTVTMWHFGADASVEYSGERFCVAWETAENVLLRAYSKTMNDNRTRIRLERQEYPKATLADLIEQKINQNQRYEG
jgi:hypothetical protein